MSGNTARMTVSEPRDLRASSIKTIGHLTGDPFVRGRGRRHTGGWRTS